MVCWMNGQSVDLDDFLLMAGDYFFNNSLRYIPVIPAYIEFNDLPQKLRAISYEYGQGMNVEDLIRASCYSASESHNYLLFVADRFLQISSTMLDELSAWSNQYGTVIAYFEQCTEPVLQELVERFGQPVNNIHS